MDLLSKKFFLLILCISLAKTICISQKSDEVIHKLKPNAISFSYLGASPLGGFTYERLIKQIFCLEGGIGVFGFGMGVTVLPKKLRFARFSTYFGFKQSRFAAPTAYDAYVAYLPFGINFTSKKNIQLSIDLGPAYGKNSAGRDGTKQGLFVFGNLKVGYRFGKIG